MDTMANTCCAGTPAVILSLLTSPMTRPGHHKGDSQNKMANGEAIMGVDLGQGLMGNKETRDKGRARAKGKAETSAPSRVGRRGELGKWRRVGCWKRETGAHSEGMKWIPWRIPAVQGHQR